MTDDAFSHTDVQLVNQVAQLDPTIGGADTVSGGADPISGGADPTSGGAYPTSGHADSSDCESCDWRRSKQKYDNSGIKIPANMALAMPEASSSSYSKDALNVVGHEKALAVALGCKFDKQERLNLTRRACAMLLRVPERKVQEYMQLLNIARGPSVLVAAAERVGEEFSPEAQSPVNNSVEDQERQAFLNIVRAALAAWGEGHSDCQFMRQLSRLQLSGFPFGESLEVLGSECVRTTLAMQLRRRSRGLQIRSLSSASSSTA